MLSAIRTMYTTWLLAIWCGCVAAWVLVDRRGVAMCVFGWLRCGDRGTGGSLWLEPMPVARIAMIWLAGVVLLAALGWVEARRRKADVPLAGRAPRIRTVALVGVAGTLAAAHLLLLAPVWDTVPCGETIRINSALAYPLNCDSGQFLELAHDPGMVLDTGNTRQSRPGYVFLSAAATAVVGPVASAVGLDRAYGSDDSAYVPLVLINLLIAAATLALFCWLLRRLGVSWVVVGLTGTSLMVNDVTKAYYWSPHQQMFALFVPVVAIAVGAWLLTRQPSPRQLAVLGLSLGLSMLVYGSFIVPLAVAGLLMGYAALRRAPVPTTVTLPRQRRHAPSEVSAPALVASGQAGTAAVPQPAGAAGTPDAATTPRESTGGGTVPWPRRLPRLAGRLAVLGAVAAAPSLAWIAVCVAVAGSYYNHETVVYHEFVWLPEALREGGAAFAQAVADATAETSQQLIEVGWPWAGALGLLVAAAVVTGVRLVPPAGAGPDAPVQRAALLATAVTGAVTVLFLFGMGFWAYRITYNIVPVLLVALAWVATKVAAGSTAARWAVHVALGAATVAWVAFQVLSHGPYS
ncbi:hypothetical protein Daura_26450 [Dactylosporangium aurantiacum]|uniref:Uncharacterized protein n=1 Tax=Dactylosporangium aurantiacum TaxID=35754 RepID=A0A9Q9MDK5_9ACTN|nr:hypothetical protein [Dactylosporangium aurantiacum]MDG6109295.1 hypothetical protein [Dactylosporangium aurantiacum]UWZ50380.1 hypothetical protein Daura_26450 [Dactylosporangium aurantiacum]